MDKKIKILLIEDVPEDIRFTEIQLNSIFAERHTLEVRDYFSKAMQLLQKKTFDIIIIDLSLPDSNGLTNLKKLASSFNIPVIIYTGLNDESVKNEALSGGAMDYLIKGQTMNNTLKESIVNSIIQYSLSGNKKR